MTTKDKIYEYLKTKGPADHKTLATKLKTKEPSIRRSCQQLFAEHKLEDGGSAHGHKVWKISVLQHVTDRMQGVDCPSCEDSAPHTHGPIKKSTPDKPTWAPGDESDKLARRHEIEERAKQLQGGPKLL